MTKAQKIDLGPVVHAQYGREEGVRLEKRRDLRTLLGGGRRRSTAAGAWSWGSKDLRKQGEGQDCSHSAPCSQTPLPSAASSAGAAPRQCFFLALTRDVVHAEGAHERPLLNRQDAPPEVARPASMQATGGTESRNRKRTRRRRTLDPLDSFRQSEDVSRIRHSTANGKVRPGQSGGQRRKPCAAPAGQLPGGRGL